MANNDCGMCHGSGRWRGQYGGSGTCFRCDGTGKKKVRQSRARRQAAAVSTGRMLQIDAMPTLEEAREGRTAHGGVVVGKMGPGAQRLRAARVAILPPAMPQLVQGDLMSKPFHDGSVVQKADVGGRIRTYDEVFQPE